MLNDVQVHTQLFLGLLLSTETEVLTESLTIQHITSIGSEEGERKVAPAAAHKITLLL